ncbi:response regulator transcription factor [Cellulomonas sp. APG4]|uniref:response regulator n=1 Tax=Cellulomonas sp. APG4 TaxID=1538656 RepID=UPI00137B4A44|nr:response regulator transcription factor [Cellulomonas sp. APG4]NCT91424.1 response regulator transcription factor [Cellulomonas sp. APG4]
MSLAAERTVVVVDDDRTLTRTLVISLRSRGWRALVAHDGATGLELAETARPDVVVLDLGLPDLDGHDVLARLRTWSQTPVVVLTARHARAEAVRALDAGADDYVTKPFSVDELLARLRAAVRRADPAQDAPVVETGALRIDLARGRVHREGVEVRLTPTEWAVLELLVRRRGHVVPTAEILRAVWGPAYGTESNYLRVYTAQLRRKLEADPARPRHLVTRPGRGYVFDP